MRQIARWGLGAMAAAGLFGCRHDAAPRVWKSPAQFTPPVRGELPAGPSEHLSLFPGLGNVPGPDELDRRSKPSAAPGRPLGVAETIRRAADNSPTAWMLVQEREALARQYQAADDRTRAASSCAVTLQQELLSDAAVEARNRSAAGALEAYYRLAQTDLQGELVLVGADEVRKTLAEADEPAAKRMLVPGATDEFVRRSFEFRKQTIEIDRFAGQLEWQLRDALRLGPEDDSWRIRPETSLEISVEPWDRAAETAVGLANNHELVLLRNLLSKLNSANLPAARAALSQVSPLMGATIPSLPKCLAICLGGLKGDDCALPAEASDLHQRTLQLQALIHAREGETTRRIAQAIVELEGRARAIALERERMRSFEREVADLENALRLGQSDFLRVSAARLKYVESRAAVAEQVIAWHLARVQLRSAQGRLLGEGLSEVAAPPTVPATDPAPVPVPPEAVPLPRPSP